MNAEELKAHDKQYTNGDISDDDTNKQCTFPGCDAPRSRRWPVFCSMHGVKADRKRKKVSRDKERSEVIERLRSRSSDRDKKGDKQSNRQSSRRSRSMGRALKSAEASKIRRERPKSAKSKDDASIFARLASTGNYTGVVRRKREEQKRRKKRQEWRAKNAGKPKKEPEIPEVVNRLTDQKGYTGIVKRNLQEKEKKKHQARKQAARRRRIRARQERDAADPNSIFNRLASRDSLTGLSRRLHERVVSPGNSVSTSHSRRSRSSGRSAGKRAAGTFGRTPTNRASDSIGSAEHLSPRRFKTQVDLSVLGITSRVFKTIVRDFVCLLTSPDPTGSDETVAALQRLKQSVKGKEWGDPLLDIVNRHLAATSREETEATMLTGSTAPSSRGAVRTLSDLASLPFTKEIASRFRQVVLGQDMLTDRNAAGLQSIDRAALVQAVFPDHAQQVQQKKAWVLYGVRVGARMFIGKVSADSNSSVASQFLGAVRGAFFSGADNKERYELCHALRTIPVKNWKGHIIKLLPGADSTDAEFEVIRQVEIFEQGTLWPMGLNAVVNSHLKGLIDKYRLLPQAQMPRGSFSKDPEVQGKMDELQRAQAAVAKLQKELAELKTHAPAGRTTSHDDEVSFMDPPNDDDEKLLSLAVQTEQGKHSRGASVHDRVSTYESLSRNNSPQPSPRTSGMLNDEDNDVKPTDAPANQNMSDQDQDADLGGDDQERALAFGDDTY